MFRPPSKKRDRRSNYYYHPKSITTTNHNNNSRRLGDDDDDDDDDDGKNQKKKTNQVEKSSKTTTTLFNNDNNDNKNNSTTAAAAAATTTTTTTTKKLGGIKVAVVQPLLSFMDDDDDNNEDDNEEFNEDSHKKKKDKKVRTSSSTSSSRKKRKVKRGQFGGGGTLSAFHHFAATTANNSDDHENDNDTNVSDDSNNDKNDTSALYDKESLKMLLEEQQKEQTMMKNTKLPKTGTTAITNNTYDDNDNDSDNDNDTNPSHDVKIHHHHHPAIPYLSSNILHDDQQNHDNGTRFSSNTITTNNAEEATAAAAEALPDYIPLNRSSVEYDTNTTILAGDEAIEIMMQQQQQQQQDDGNTGGVIIPNDIPPTSYESNSGDSNDDFVRLTAKIAEHDLPNDDQDEDRFGKNNRTRKNAKIKSQDNDHDDEDEQNHAQWETEITRRAGVSSAVSQFNNNTASSSLTGPYNNEASTETSSYIAQRNNNRPRSKSLDIMRLRHNISKSIEQLDNQRNDIQSTERRRMYDMEQAQIEVQKHEKDVQEAGTALEFYQLWREKLIGWVGAIRELRNKIEPILSALHTLQAEQIAINQWQEYENDIISILYEHHILEKVLGRQPPDIIYRPNNTITTAMDEFGRDVQSQHKLQREQRRKKRKQIQMKRQYQQQYTSTSITTLLDNTPPTYSMYDGVIITGTDEADGGFISEEEEESFRTRHTALHQALHVATDEINNEYMILGNLISLFHEWYKQYPTEYKQCYANLSLADLASILIQIELCSLNDPYNESAGYNESKWTTSIHTAIELKIIDDIAIERLIERSVVPVMNDLFNQNSIYLGSSQQMISMRHFISNIQKLVPNSSSVLRTIRARMITYANEQLSTIAIPIIIKNTTTNNRDIKRSSLMLQQQQQLLLVGETEEVNNNNNNNINIETNTNHNNNNDDDELNDAIFVSTEGQVRRIKKILMNLLLHWAPIIPNDLVFVDNLMYFITDKFLILLSSIIHNEQQQQSQQQQQQQHEGQQQDISLVNIESSSPAKLALREIIDVLDSLGWLSWPELMLQTEIIRSAETAFLT